MSGSFNQPPQPALPPPNPAPEGYEPIHPGSGRPGVGKRLASALAALGVLLAVLTIIGVFGAASGCAICTL